MLAFVFVTLASACSYQAELEQEVKSANEYLPQPINVGLIAERITLEDSEIVYHITADDNYYSNFDFNNKAFALLVGFALVDKNDSHLAEYLKRAGYGVCYRVTMKDSRREFDIHIPNENLDVEP